MRRWESYSEFKDYTSDSSFLIRVQLSILLEKEIFEGKYILLHLLCLLHLMCFYRLISIILYSQKKKKRSQESFVQESHHSVRRNRVLPRNPVWTPMVPICIFVARFSFELLNNDHPCLLILMSS